MEHVECMEHHGCDMGAIIRLVFQSRRVLQQIHYYLYFQSRANTRFDLATCTEKRLFVTQRQRRISNADSVQSTDPFARAATTT